MIYFLLNLYIRLLREGNQIYKRSLRRTKREEGKKKIFMRI